MIKKLVFFLVFFSVFSFSLLAETIVLKSGKTIEAKIIDKTGQKIRVYIEGVPVTYYLNEVESIDGKKVTKPSADSVAVNKEIVTPVKDTKEFVRKLNQAYYNLKIEGLEEFKCEIANDILAQVREVLLTRYAAGSPEMKAIDSIKFYLFFDKNGNCYVEDSRYRTGNENFSDKTEALIDDIDKMLVNLWANWKIFIFNDIIDEKDIDYCVINETKNGYEVLYSKPERSVKMVLGKNLLITQVLYNISNSKTLYYPQFIKTPRGFLLNGYSAYFGPGLVTNMVIEYQDVNGLQMPKHVTMETAVQETRRNADIVFSNYQIKKRGI